MNLQKPFYEFVPNFITSGIHVGVDKTLSGKYYLFSPWYNLNMGNEELDQLRRQEILAIAHRYGAQNVRIFGSVARHEARLDSDIDFLVKMEPGRSLFDLGGMLYDLQELLGVEVDVVTEKGLRARIREQVLCEAVPL